MIVSGVIVLKISLCGGSCLGRRDRFAPLGQPCGQQMRLVCMYVCALLSCEQMSPARQLAPTVVCTYSSLKACLFYLLQMMPWIQLAHMSDMNKALDEIHTSQSLGQKAEIFQSDKGNVSGFPSAELFPLQEPLITPNKQKISIKLCRGNRQVSFSFMLDKKFVYKI